MTTRRCVSDNDILRLLADQRGRTVLSMAERFAVAQITIRNALLRLTLAQAVTGNATIRRTSGADHLTCTTLRVGAQQHWRRRQMKELRYKSRSLGWSGVKPCPRCTAVCISIAESHGLVAG